MVLLFSDTIPKRNNRQLYLLTCHKCYLPLVGLSDMYLHESMQYLIPHHSLPMSGRNLLVNRCLKPTE